MMMMMVMITKRCTKQMILGPLFFRSTFRPWLERGCMVSIDQLQWGHLPGHLAWILTKFASKLHPKLLLIYNIHISYHIILGGGFSTPNPESQKHVILIILQKSIVKTSKLVTFLFQFLEERKEAKNRHVQKNPYCEAIGRGATATPRRGRAKSSRC